jgi:predicted O-methyltransferase YrrM
MRQMLDWKNDTHLVLEGADFTLAPTALPAGRMATAAGTLVLRKPRWMVERYAALRSEIDAANVFEVGIYEGGSTALLALLFRPRRLVAIDLEPTRAPVFQDFIDAHGLQETVRPYFGVDQADRARIDDILAHEYGSEPLDLVIDDASHLLHETTASFNVLFPRLRPGGLFVLEDWSSRHERERAMEMKLRSDEGARQELARRLETGVVAARREDPLSRLVLELVLTAAYADDVVAEVMSVQRSWVVVRRGDATLDPKEFDIAQCYGSLGATLLHHKRSRT